MQGTLCARGTRQPQQGQIGIALLILGPWQGWEGTDGQFLKVSFPPAPERATGRAWCGCPGCSQGSSGEIHPLSPSPNPKCGQGSLWGSVELPALPSLLGRVSELEEFLVPKNFSSYNTKSWMVLREARDRGALRHRDGSGVQEYPSQQRFRAGFGAAASQQLQGRSGIWGR